MLEEFYNIFGPELKSVTGDPKRIEDVVKRVDALVTPIEQVDNNFIQTRMYVIIPSLYIYIYYCSD